MPSGTATSFGRIQVAEPFSRLARLHLWKGTPLTTRDWEPKNAVLDQEDLLAQGIDCSSFILGCKTNPDALGSCTANAGTSALSNVLDESDYLDYTAASSYDDTVGLEKHAILFYHNCTDLTGDPATEWPPVDCGSSGLYVCDLMEDRGVISGDRIAHGAQNIVSLMQSGGLLAGIPYLNDWMQPDSSGFVDGDGSAQNLEAQIADGVAGGHEIYLSAIEALRLSETGAVEPQDTVIRFRNSWDSSWGDNGSARFHLSTLVYLGSQCDFRQLVAKSN